MKKALLACGSVLGLLLAACGDENNDWISPADEYTTSALVNGIEIPPQGTGFDLLFDHSETVCKAQTAPGSERDFWKVCEVTKETTGDNQTHFHFNVPAYDGFAAMNMGIRFVAGGSSLDISLKQEAPLHVAVEEESWPVPTEGGILKIPGHANVKFSVAIPESCQDWVHLDNIEERGMYHEITIMLRVDANLSGTSRSCQIDLKTNYGNTTGKIVVSQL